MKNFLIIGMGEFGTRIATRLQALKNDVCVVDTNYEKINLITPTFNNAVCADAMNPQALKDLGVKSFDACIVTVGQNFQASLEITSRLKEFGARYVLCKSYSDIQSKFLKIAGADETIYPEKEVAEKVAVTLNSQFLLNYFDISNDYGVYEMKALRDWLGRSLVDLNLRRTHSLNVMAVRTGEKVILPDPSYTFTEGDTVYVFGPKNQIDRLVRHAK